MFESLLPEALHGGLVHTALVVVLVVAAWLAMWQLFLRHIPVLVAIKEVVLGQRRLPPRGRKRTVVFRHGADGQQSSASAAAPSDSK